jgi:citrate synthase
MGYIKEKFQAKAEEVAAEIKDLLKNHGDKQIDTVHISQVYQGMRGVTGLVSETSLLDPLDGIRFRGYSIPELRDQLPKIAGGSEPLPEGLFYLMLIGELPNDEQVHHISNTWGRRSQIPRHVFNTIDKLPVETHPMTQFSIGITAMQT